MNIAAPRILVAGLLPTGLLLTGMACTFAFSASAQDVTVAVAVEPEDKAAQSTEEAGNTDRTTDRHCLRATGSRTVAMQNTRSEAGKRCAIGPGRVHTSEDLQRTGATSLGDALRRLEPSSR